MTKTELSRKSNLDLVKNKLITLKEASCRLNLSYRQTRRIFARYKSEEDKGLIHRNRGKTSHAKIDQTIKDKVLDLYRAKYLDFGPTLASEKLLELDKIKINSETLRLWLKEAGLWHTKRIRSKYRTRRERKLRFGDLLQIDGSIHAWFEGNPDKQCLLNIVDDATGKTESVLAKGETTESVYRALTKWINKYGVPLAIYVDLKNLYVSPKELKAIENSENSEDEPEYFTCLSAACKKLNIQILKAYSPQAKGRVERNHAVYQDRLVKELKLYNIKTIESANEFLDNKFIDSLNKKFEKPPASNEDAHRKLDANCDLNNIFCWEYSRVMQNDMVIRFSNQILQIQKSKELKINPKQKVTVKRHMNGEISISFNGKKLTYSVIQKIAKPPKKLLSSTERSAIAKSNSQNSPWRGTQTNFNAKSKEQNFSIQENKTKNVQILT